MDWYDKGLFIGFCILCVGFISSIYGVIINNLDVIFFGVIISVSVFPYTVLIAPIIAKGMIKEYDKKKLGD